MLNYEVGTYAALGGAATAVIVGVLTGPESVGITTLIGIVLALGGAIGAAYIAFQAYLAHNDANYYWTIAN